jgi:MinD superfamily P-loop ATPase
MNITIASGKGGTGKTTFAVNLAYFLTETNNNVRLLDGDVEEPNDHLFVPSENMKEETVTVLKPEFHLDKCTGCGKCIEACTYNALALVKGKILIFNELCHACGACSYVCPHDALTEKSTPLGKVLSSELTEERPFYFAYGILNIGESLAPAVVKHLKKHMKTAESDSAKESPENDPDSDFFPHTELRGNLTDTGMTKNTPIVNILDASPGTACPVVEALSGDNTIAVLVTEPTPFGLNDLKLAAELSLNMGNPTGIVINRSDGDDKIIADFAEEYDIPILGRIPFDRKYAETYSKGGVLIQHHSELIALFADIFENIKKLEGKKPSGKPFTYIKQEPIEHAKFNTGRADSYKEIVVISGKGGTGKTTITSSMTQLCDENVVFDSDVDAADLHLLLKPQMVKKEEFSGSNEFIIDSDKCFGCGQCATHCHFDAIDLTGPGNYLIGMTYEVDPLACEGCGLCQIVCSVDAISSKPAHTGESYLSVTGKHSLINNDEVKSADYAQDRKKYISNKKALVLKGMIHAKLGVGGENSGKLVSHVRSESANFAKEYKQPYIIGDGPPGTSCPVIASVTGADLILMVTEPTVSGVHDLQRVMELVKHFGVKSLVIINKADLNKEMTEKIYKETEKYNSKVIAEIPFDRNIHDSLMAEKTIVEYGKGEAAKIISGLWDLVSLEIRD